MAEGQQPVDDVESEALVPDALVDAATESDSDGGTGGDSAGGSSGGGGSVGGTANVDGPASAVPVYVVTSVPPLHRDESTPRDSVPDATQPAAEAPAPQRDLAAEAAQAFSVLAARLGRSADVRYIELSPDGIPSAGVPMHAQRRGPFGLLGVVVAPTPEAARALVGYRRGRDRSAPRNALDEFLRGAAGREPFERRGSQPRFVNRDGHQITRDFLAGVGAQDVRDDRIPDGSMQRRSALPDTLEQALSEFRKGFKAQAARPKPLRPESERRSLLGIRRSRTMIAPAEMTDELEQELPGVTVVGFQPSIPGSLEQEFTTAIDAVAAFQADQEAQRAKLVAALKQLWAQRVTLLAGGRELSESEQMRLADVDQRIGALVNLVRFGQLAMEQLDTAERSIYRAGHDVESALHKSATTTRPGAVASELSSGVAELESVTADAELVGATAKEVADAAHVTVVETDTQIADWAQQQLESPEPPAELVSAVEELELPPGISLSNVDEVTGNFDVTVDQTLDSVGADTDADSPSQERGVTAVQTLGSEVSAQQAAAEQEPAVIPAPVVPTQPDVGPQPDAGPEPVVATPPDIPASPDIEPLAPRRRDTAAGVPDSEEGTEQAPADAAPQLDLVSEGVDADSVGTDRVDADVAHSSGGRVESVPKATDHLASDTQLPDPADGSVVSASPDSASRQQHREVERRAAQGEPVVARPAESADDGSLEPNDSSGTPSEPAGQAGRSAFTRGVLPEADDDSDGSSTAASMAKKDKPVVASHVAGGDESDARDALVVARDARIHQRVINAGNRQHDADAARERDGVEADAAKPEPDAQVRDERQPDDAGLNEEPTRETADAESDQQIRHEPQPVAAADSAETATSEAAPQRTAPVDGDELGKVPPLDPELVRGSDDAAHPVSPATPTERSGQTVYATADRAQLPQRQRRPGFTEVEVIRNPVAATGGQGRPGAPGPDRSPAHATSGTGAASRPAHATGPPR